MKHKNLIALLSFLSGAFWAFLLLGLLSIYILFSHISTLYAIVSMFLFGFISLFIIAVIELGLYILHNFLKN